MTDSFVLGRLYRVGLQSLEQTMGEVEGLAEAIWYQGYCPSRDDLEQLRAAMPRESFLRSLCVLEMVSQYPGAR